MFFNNTKWLVIGAIVTIVANFFFSFLDHATFGYLRDKYINQDSIAKVDTVQRIDSMSDGDINISIAQAIDKENVGKNARIETISPSSKEYQYRVCGVTSKKKLERDYDRVKAVTYTIGKVKRHVVVIYDFRNGNVSAILNDTMFDDNLDELEEEKEQTDSLKESNTNKDVTDEDYSNDTDV